MWKSSNEKATQVVENDCPYCHEHLIMNKRSFANHVRWCKSNPRYEEIRKGTIKKLSEHNREKRVKIKGELKTFSVKCANPKCGCYFEVTEYEYDFPSKEKYYCCRSCANSHEKTEKTRKKTSESLKKYAKKNGKFVREELFKIERICPQCSKTFHTKKVNQKCCCNKCAIEYKNRQHYKTLLDGCEDIERIKLIRNIYKKQCSFKFALNAYPDEFDFSLITESGWYKAKNHGNNLKGVSRDHMFSVNEGFRLRVDPYIISHPANCRLMKHSKNSSKHDKCSTTLEELNRRIFRWEEKYGKYENKIDYKLLEEIGYTVEIFLTERSV